MVCLVRSCNIALLFKQKLWVVLDQSRLIGSDWVFFFCLLQCILSFHSLVENDCSTVIKVLYTEAHYTPQFDKWLSVWEHLQGWFLFIVHIQPTLVSTNTLHHFIFIALQVHTNTICHICSEWRWYKMQHEMKYWY